jgi:hypothetical protein
MTDKRLFDIDPLTGAKRYFSYDDDTGQCTLQTTRDVSDLIELNKLRYNSVSESARWGDGQVVASIPLELLAELQRSGIANDQEKMRAWLNDSDNRYFRIRPGKV